MKLHIGATDPQGQTWGYFECPGCGIPHGLVINGPGAWGFNGDPDKPTITPSVLVSWPEGKERITKVCHSFITDGRIQFLEDCTHVFAGKEVDLPDWD